MARRLNVNRLILVLGVAVALLGALSLWAAIRGMTLGPRQPTAVERALTQIRQQMGPGGELRYSEPGEGRALCGYAGRKGQEGAVSFVSRPNRILFSDDPLPTEFQEMRERFCPGFLALPDTPEPTA